MIAVARVGRNHSGCSSSWRTASVIRALGTSTATSTSRPWQSDQHDQARRRASSDRGHSRGHPSTTTANNNTSSTDSRHRNHYFGGADNTGSRPPELPSWSGGNARRQPVVTPARGSVVARGQNRSWRAPQPDQRPPPKHILELQQQQQRQEERAEKAGLPPPPPATGKGGRGTLVFQESDSYRFVLHIRELTRQGNLAGVLSALSIAERKEGGVDVHGYNACIGGMSKVRRWADALELLSRMRAAGVAPDTRSFVGAIEACCRGGQFGHVPALRRSMVAAGVPQRPGCYRSELEHFGNSGMWRQALDLLSELRTAELTPDAKMYNCVLDAFARSTEWKKAADIMREMERAGHELHARSYRGVIVSASNAGEWRVAWRVFKRMNDLGVKKSSRSPVIFNSVTAACGIAGRWEEALYALRLTQREGIPPTLIAYNATLGALGKAGQWQHAQRLLRDMRQRGAARARLSPPRGGSQERPRYIPSPDVYSYTSVIDACAKAGQLERALAVLEEMHHAKVRPSLVTLNALISACRARGEWRRALSFVGEMGKFGVTPDDFTLTVTVAACEASGEWGAVARHLREMASGDAFVASLAITACGRAGDWQSGSEVVRELGVAGAPRDVGVYNALIEALAVRPSRRG